MESNGKRNRIQVSQKTADLIELAGKGHWLTPRLDKIDAKGNGQMQTFWCEPKSGNNSTGSGSDDTSSGSDKEPSDKPKSHTFLLERLVDWNVDMFEGLLKKVVALREVAYDEKTTTPFDVSAVPTIPGNPLDELSELILMPAAKATSIVARAETPLSTAASSQLREFIVAVAQMYRANPFHNFDHCSHVAMSTKKLLDRICSKNALKEFRRTR